MPPVLWESFWSVIGCEKVAAYSNFVKSAFVMDIRPPARDVLLTLKASLNTAFIDGRADSSLETRPMFLRNAPKEGEKFLCALEDELKDCTSFSISVAFISLSGVTPLLQVLREAERRNVRGRILTTDYLGFTEPAALKKLRSLKNLEVRLFRTSEARVGFHTKGYLFRHADGVDHLLLGSSNITGSALTVNQEWNVKLASAANGEFAKSAFRNFDALWNARESKSLDDVLPNYEAEYKVRRPILRNAVGKDAVRQAERLNLNKMQRRFIRNIERLIEQGEKRALLISATGTGKTYAAAFAVQAAKPKRLLFVVHREQIARQAMKSFRRVLGDAYTYGVVSGTTVQKDFTPSAVFTTVQTLSRPDILQRAKAADFDWVIIDESHRSGAESYQRIMATLEPDFWLGMTASPDRMDGFDVYALFGHNIACEIRLQEALDEDLLCPFHYFGIAEAIDLPFEERVDAIIDNADYYGYSGSCVKGLIFAKDVKEAYRLEAALNARGLRTKALSGKESINAREAAIARLVMDEGESGDAHEAKQPALFEGIEVPGEKEAVPETGKLDYLITVDIFNEGVDIPEVNQVIFLRETQSSIVFIQQLGRGLRKAEDKDFVVILDFIGAYDNNYLIPIALTGNRTYNKDDIRRELLSGSRVMPGAATIHFDEISRERIFKSIETAKTNSIRLLKTHFEMLRRKIGRRPQLTDFLDHASIDPTKYLRSQGCSSYEAFVAKHFPDVALKLSGDEVLDRLAGLARIGKGLREAEILLLEAAMDGGPAVLAEAKARNAQSSRRQIPDADWASAIRVLTNAFTQTRDAVMPAFMRAVFLEPNGAGDWRMHADWRKWLCDEPDFETACREYLALMRRLFEERLSGNEYRDTTFCLYEKYTYEEVCRLLNWPRNLNAQTIGGYAYDVATKTLPVFINYEKKVDAIQYADRFLSDSVLMACSKSNRSIDSVDADRFFKRGAANADNRIFLFVRRSKDDNEAKAFYFLGEIEAQGQPIPVSVPSSNAKSGEFNAFEVRYRLETPVRSDIYDYLRGALDGGLRTD